MSEMSLQAFSKVLKDLPERQAKVYNCIKQIESRNYYATVKNVAFMLKVEKNVISGRFTDLQDQGLLIDSGERVGRYTIWKTVNPDQVEDLRALRSKQKFQSDVRNFLSKWKGTLDDSVIFNLSAYL